MNGRIKQSIVSWCFMSAGEKWSLDKMCEVTKDFGVPSVETGQSRAVRHAEEARPDLRHRIQRHAGAAS